jgi:hypothetical protein
VVRIDRPDEAEQVVLQTFESVKAGAFALRDSDRRSRREGLQGITNVTR